MTNRFQTPDEQFFDGPTTNYAPLAGGSLFFFQSGTNTPLNTFSDAGLTTPNANPIVLDSAGRAGSIFLSNANYKVVLVSALGTTVWTQDPVRTSDFSGTAQFSTFAGNPNGSLPGTAGSGSTPTSVIWDSTDQLLYICTATGTSASAVWTAINQSSVANTAPPQGYLTLTSQTPVIAADVTGATSVFYTPTVGSQAPIFNGTAMAMQTFAELTLSLVSQHVANTVYDVFLFSNSGVVTLATGPAWSISQGSTASRGTGAGTTQLSRVGGFLVNTVQITGRNGASTFTIPASFATYLGSIYIDNTAGQVSCTLSHGQNRKWGVWNAYNRQTIMLSCGDGTTGWNYSTATQRASNNVPTSFAFNTFNFNTTTANGVNIFCGLAEEKADIAFHQYTIVEGNGGTGNVGNFPTMLTIIAVNATTGVVSGEQGQNSNFGNININGATGTARFVQPPALGVNVAVCCESVFGAGSFTTARFFGTEAQMKMVVSYRG